MEHREQEIQSILRHVANILLINGGFLNNPGLYTGEMGLVLFFTRYARFTHNDLYLDYAYGLIEKIQRRIHQDTPVNYRHGLTGIGSATEYLVQNGFFEADTDEILEDFDKRIYFTYNIPYLPVEDMIDIWYYIQWRLSVNSMQQDKIRQFILPQIEKSMHHHSVDPATLAFHRKVIPAGFEEKTFDRCLNTSPDPSKDGNLKSDFWNKELGLQNGLAGWGMSLLTEIDGDNTWFPLLPSNSRDAMHCVSTNH